MREVGFVVNFTAVGFGYEGTDEVPGDFGGGDISSTFRYCFDPGVDDVSCALVLDRVS